MHGPLPLRAAFAIACTLATTVHARQAVDLPPAIGDLAAPASLGGSGPRSRALYLSLIETMRRDGQIHAALAHLDAFDRQYPKSRDAALLRAHCLVDIARYEPAGAIYRTLLRGKEAAAAYTGLARIEALGGRWTAATDLYARAVALAPTSPVMLGDYGFALLRAGKASDAVFRLRQAAEMAPGDTRVRNNLVLALAASGDASGAERLLAGVTDSAERAELEAEMAALRAAN